MIIIKRKLNETSHDTDYRRLVKTRFSIIFGFLNHYTMAWLLNQENISTQNRFLPDENDG